MLRGGDYIYIYIYMYIYIYIHTYIHVYMYICIYAYVYVYVYVYMYIYIYIYTHVFGGLDSVRFGILGGETLRSAGDFPRTSRLRASGLVLIAISTNSC